MSRSPSTTTSIAALRRCAPVHRPISASTTLAGSRRAVFDHAIKRHRLLKRLSDADSTVLSILNSINDGVVIADRDGNLLDINPAARSILGMGARERPGENWTQKFGRTGVDGESDVETTTCRWPKPAAARNFPTSLRCIARTEQRHDPEPEWPGPLRLPASSLAAWSRFATSRTSCDATSNSKSGRNTTN